MSKEKQFFLASHIISICISAVNRSYVFRTYLVFIVLINCVCLFRTYIGTSPNFSWFSSPPRIYSIKYNHLQKYYLVIGLESLDYRGKYLYLFRHDAGKVCSLGDWVLSIILVQVMTPCQMSVVVGVMESSELEKWT